MMAKSRESHIGLAWTQGELAETLWAARRALETYALAARGDSGTADAELTDCVAGIHQVHGVLVMIERRSAATFAEHLEAVALALAEGRLADPAGAVASLIQGLLELPRFLDAQRFGLGDTILPLLTLLNDLRAHLGRPPLAAPSIGLQLSGTPDRQALERFAGIAGQDKARKLRGVYQQVLLATLKGGVGRDSVETLQKVAAGMKRVCEGTPQAVLWQLFGAFLEALHAGLPLQPTGLQPDVVKLLRRMDAELREVARAGVAALTASVAPELAEQLLSETRARGGESDFLDAVEHTLAIARMTEAFASAGPDALAANAAALREDLADVRDQTDRLLRDARSGAAVDGGDGVLRLMALAKPLRRLSGAMSLLGLEGSRAVLAEQIDRLDHAATAEPALLESLTETLGQVDRNLAILSEGRRSDAEPMLDASQQATIARARQGLDQLKQAVVDYVSSQWDVRHLQMLPAALAEDAVALRQIPLVAAADLFERCVAYVADTLLAGHVPDWGELDQFAGAVSGIDYYLERLSEPVADGAEDILAFAERSLVALESAVSAVVPAVDLEPPSSPVAAASEQPPATPVDGPDADTPAVPATGAGGDADFATDANPLVAAALERLAALRDDPEVDADILAVFAEEVDEVLAAMDARLGPWRRDFGQGHHVVELRRSFHTLKGSGRLVGANRMGELAWSIERMLNRLLDHTIEASPRLVELVERARALLPDLRTAFVDRAEYPLGPVARLVAEADWLIAGAPAIVREPTEPDAASPTAALDSLGGPMSERAAPDGDRVPSAAEPTDARAAFIEEAHAHLSVLAAAVTDGSLRLDEAVVRALHTLAGSAAMVGIPTVAELARALLDVAQAELGTRESTGLDGPWVDAFEAAIRALSADIDALAGNRPLVAREPLVRQIESLRQAVVPPLVQVVLGLQGLDALLEAGRLLEDWQLDGSLDAERGAALTRGLQSLAEIVAPTPDIALAELARALLDVYSRRVGSRLDDATSGALRAAHEALLVQIDALVAGQPLRRAQAELAALAGLAAPPVERAVDQELVRIFLEEAEELLDEVDRAVQACVEGDGVQSAIEALLRVLHTLKGGARLAALAAVGDAAHDFESWLVAMVDSGAQIDSNAVGLLHDHYDALAGLIAEASTTLLANSQSVRPAAALGEAPADRAAPQVVVPDSEPAEPPLAAAPSALPPADFEAGSSTPIGVQIDRQAIELPDAADGAPLAPVIFARAEASLESSDARDPIALEPATSEFRVDERPRDRGAEEVVRVPAALLDQLVNLAGESSIMRGRAQQGLSEFGGALDEMEMTIQRLRGQLRRLEIETEAQILFRRERPESPGYEDFDPLELDRYSQLQQLSRGLSESASDMLDLKETLRQRAAETEALLIEQSRVNTELQEGLMRSRMVPFSRLLPRLRRTVRQVANDLGKSVELVAFDIEGELDRSLLDRVVAPLEHMLRNAVDHGIEAPADRRSAGKAETGQITLRLSREAGDVVLEISDDGAGIDVDRVRAKALEQGLLAPDAMLADSEICQFVFAPGFSTAASVTQISGRGVGLDVAFNEVKQLGGSIALRSTPGQGTTFLVRLPFTVSVNRALMLSVGEDLYAVPLDTIEGVVRVRADEVAALLAQNRPFTYASVAYEVRHLGQYLGVPARGDQSTGSLPVVLVRADERAVAVVVDVVQGSREIVVKGLGPQFAGLAGISGATIMGDGGVVVILDLPALVRAYPDAAPPARKDVTPATGLRSVLVVDDSVTVRKVTSRLLERQGMQVIVAKDGVEAVAALQEQRPDVMLLDVEMPRMDGFEVLRQVRHDDRLADLPIIMISSRSGAKHQDRARELGVNHFLGKPFQESELLDRIEQCLN